MTVYRIGRLGPRGGSSPRVACTACGASGYPPGHVSDIGYVYRSHWTLIHDGKKHYPCRKGCGRFLPALQDGTPRAHSRCPTEAR